MKIIRTDISDLAQNKVMVYKLTKSPSLSLQKMTDDELAKAYPVNAYLLYEDTNAKGEAVTVLSILSEGVKLSTVGKTFITAFLEIVDLMDGEQFAIRVCSGESKNKRRYFDCILDC